MVTQRERDEGKEGCGDRGILMREDTFDACGELCAWTFWWGGCCGIDGGGIAFVEVLLGDIDVDVLGTPSDKKFEAGCPAVRRR